MLRVLIRIVSYNNACSYGFFFWGLKNEFKTAVVNEPSVFKSLKFYYNEKSGLISQCSCPRLSVSWQYIAPDKMEYLLQYFFMKTCYDPSLEPSR